MAVSSTRSSGPVLRSLSPSGRFSNNRHQTSSPARSSTSGSSFASTTSAFTSRPAQFFRGSNSPTTVSSASAMRLSFDRPVTSQSRSIAASSNRNQVVRRSPMPSGGPKRTCMCSPSTHPGSFRCSLHKNSSQQSRQGSAALNARRSAMTNSLVRIGTVEGDLVKRALAALIRPSSHNQRRRSTFQPRPSRLSNMSMAEDS